MSDNGSKRIRIPEGRSARAGAIFNGVIALANVAVATLIYFQLREMQSSSLQMDKAISAAEKSAAAAQESAIQSRLNNQLQLRPIVEASVDALSLNRKDFSKSLAIIRYKNIGRLSSVDTNFIGAIKILQYPAPPGFSDPNLDVNSDDPERGDHMTLLPGQETKADIFFIDSATDLDMLKNGKFRLFALGHVRYHDSDGQRHQTPYCVSYSYDALLAVLKGSTEITGDNCPRVLKAD